MRKAARQSGLSIPHSHDTRFSLKGTHIRRHLSVLFAIYMQAVIVLIVHVLIDYILLHDKDRGTSLQNLIYFSCCFVFI